MREYEAPLKTSWVLGLTRRSLCFTSPATSLKKRLKFDDYEKKYAKKARPNDPAFSHTE
jgi:hypothetical protein